MGSPKAKMLVSKNRSASIDRERGVRARWADRLPVAAVVITSFTQGNGISALSVKSIFVESPIAGDNNNDKYTSPRRCNDDGCPVAMNANYLSRRRVFLHERMGNRRQKDCQRMCLMGRELMSKARKEMDYCALISKHDEKINERTCYGGQNSQSDQLVR
uniref:Apple domain-containing protein n=1 Tax=Steinernema glaseri TaxID=37863 RepID=A0A1I7ZGG8_9BILA